MRGELGSHGLIYAGPVLQFEIDDVLPKNGWGRFSRVHLFCEAEALLCYSAGILSFGELGQPLTVTPPSSGPTN